MSRNFYGIGQQPYAGQIGPQAAQTFNYKFGNQPPLPPTTVELNIQWITYGAGAVPNVNILANLAGASTTQTLDQILSCRIDNIGNPVPVYVYFPDTDYTIVAPPNTVVWEPVQTGQFSAWIIGEGFTTGTVGNTRVYFCNFRINPFIDYEFPQSSDLWLASSTITRGTSIYNQNYGVPALGDQFIQSVVLAVVGAGPTTTINNMFNFGGGFIYVTDLTFLLNNINFTASGGSLSLYFESTGIAGIFAQQMFSWQGSAASVQTANLMNARGNFKLDGSQIWRFRVVQATGLVAGNIQLNISYTTNPN